MRGGEGEANGRAKRKTGDPSASTTCNQGRAAERKENGANQIQFNIEKRMRTAPEIMIVTNAVGVGVGVTAEPALASGSGSFILATLKAAMALE